MSETTTNRKKQKCVECGKLTRKQTLCAICAGYMNPRANSNPLVDRKHRRIKQCFHCKRFLWLFARRLCKTCYKDHKDDYEPISDINTERKYPEPLEGGRIEPPHPTEALPGTEEKIRVMEQRLWAGQQLWHREDADEWPEVANHRRKQSSLLLETGDYEADKDDTE